MTVQPTRDQLRALADDHRAMDHDTTADAIDGLLDQLDAAEQRICDLTQDVRDERAACLDQMEQVQIRDTRIKAVEDVLNRVRKNLTAWVDEYGHEVYQGNGWAEGARAAAREALKDLDGER